MAWWTQSSPPLLLSEDPSHPGILPDAVEQRLGVEDCGTRMVLRGDVARLFAPYVRSLVTLELHDGRQCLVHVCIRDDGAMELAGVGWRVIRGALGLMPGDFAEFVRAAAPGTFLASFYDADRNERLSLDAIIVETPEIPAYVGWSQTGATSACGSEQPLQGDLTIREAMDLAVRSGAQEGSDEHYMVTKLFVNAENRAVFRTFSSDQGKLDWLRRCYEDRNNQ